MVRCSAAILAALPFAAIAQPVSIGITGAIPISPHSQAYGQQCFTSYLGNPPPGEGQCGPNTLIVRPYAVGPVIEARLPWSFSIEAGMLYQRVHRDIVSPLFFGRGTGVQSGQLTGVSASGWFFPMQLRYQFGHRRWAPFVNAGATLRHLGAFEGDGLRLDFGNPVNVVQTAHFHIESGRDLDAAWTVGGGVKRRIALFDLAPEIRFLHWTSTYYQPVQNQAMLLLTIRFPAAR